MGSIVMYFLLLKNMNFVSQLYLVYEYLSEEECIYMLTSKIRLCFRKDGVLTSLSPHVTDNTILRKGYRLGTVLN